jgi:hypothetical protein
MKEKVLLWIPRILAILAILFTMLFSIDAFDGNEPITKKLIGFLIHNVPAFLLMIALWISWKHELIGGLLFIGLSIAGSIFFGAFTGNPASLVVMGPFLVIGILFIVYHILFTSKPTKNE